MISVLFFWNQGYKRSQRREKVTNKGHTVNVCRTTDKEVSHHAFAAEHIVCAYDIVFSVRIEARVVGKKGEAKG